MGRVALVVVGVSIGILIGIGAFALFDDDRPSPVVGPGRDPVVPFPAVEHDETSAAELVEAWERWRTSTHYARGVWSRQLDVGNPPLQGQVLTVQDPPRRLTVRLGAVVELIDSTSRTCDSEVEGTLPPACTMAEGDLDYAERVAIEVATVAGYVTGADRPFDVGPGPGDDCFRAENRALLPAAPWGLWAEFCFDDETGAMASARVRRASAVDTEIMFEIRGEVDPTDFDPG